MRSFNQLLHAQWRAGRVLCIALDPVPGKIPPHITLNAPECGEASLVFNTEIIDATADFAAAYKLNSAYYEAMGRTGWNALVRTVGYIQGRYPRIPIILDAKRGDVLHTSERYAEAAFKRIGVDAVTVHPYCGRASLEPFLSRPDKGVFVLCRTSDDSALQTMLVQSPYAKKPIPFFAHVAHDVAAQWNQNGNCGLVVGATHAADILTADLASGNSLPLLVPGAGAQGADLREALRPLPFSSTRKFLLVSGRSIIYASPDRDFALKAHEAAHRLHNEVHTHLAGFLCG
ncbi:MAG: orotidine-5'-phosphate decarboxylase [Patescibacteria group bacterium]